MACLDEHTRAQVLALYWSRPLSVRAIARLLGIKSHMAVWRLVRASANPYG